MSTIRSRGNDIVESVPRFGSARISMTVSARPPLSSSLAHFRKSWPTTIAIAGRPGSAMSSFCAALRICGSFREARSMSTTVCSPSSQ